MKVPLNAVIYVFNVEVSLTFMTVIVKIELKTTSKKHCGMWKRCRKELLSRIQQFRRLESR